MKARDMVRRLALLVFCAAMLSGCSDEVYEWRQKVTVIVETPDGVKTASSVTAASYTIKPDSAWRFPDSGKYIFDLSGEAVVLELGSGRFVFALLKEMPSAMKVFFPDKAHYDAAAMLPELRETRDLAYIGYPLLVTFEDINDPASVKRVNPDDLAASFGPGYHLQSITMTITDQPVTEGKVEKVLGWRENHEMLKALWPKISSEKRTILSSVNWKDY